MTKYEDVIEKLAREICIIRNYNWDYLGKHNHIMLKNQAIELLKSIPELAIVNRNALPPEPTVSDNLADKSILAGNSRANQQIGISLMLKNNYVKEIKENE